ncbi:leucine-rich repeat domain-containing protein, partial [Klebsiella pneumoniae]|uniref:leucine-rich repeat domain-containing protein n=1 Tax=Klebsiella pneumoniae TaxID=573 RepID=UPI00117A9B3D
CSGLTGITVESGNLYYSSVDGMLLSKDGTVLIQCPGGKTGSLVIPEGVTSIGDYAFSWCYGLDGTLTLPSTLESIGVYAFDGCDGLNGNLVSPQGVTSIGNQAFEGCSGLASVTFKGHAPELK